MPSVLVLYSIALPGGASDASASANDATAGEFVVSTPAALTVGRLRAAWPWPCGRGRALLRAQVAPPNEAWVWMDLAGDDDSRVPTRTAPEGCGAELVAVVRCVPFDALEAPPCARAPAPAPEFEMLPEQWERWRTARARAEPEEAYEPFSLARFPLPEEPAGAGGVRRQASAEPRSSLPKDERARPAPVAHAVRLVPPLSPFDRLRANGELS